MATLSTSAEHRELLQKAENILSALLEALLRPLIAEGGFQLAREILTEMIELARRKSCTRDMVL